MNDARPILGLSGTFASGKDTLADYLVRQCNYLHISTGDLMRAEAQRVYGTMDRPAMYKIAQRLRETHGGGATAEIALQKWADDSTHKGIVISGLRSMGEVKTIRAAGGIIVFVDAPVELRYQRIISRKRDEEAHVTLEAFKQREAAEWHAGDADTDFNFRDIKATADIALSNAASLETFLEQARKELHLP